MANRPKFTVNINVSKIDKSAIYEGQNGKYVGMAFFENRDGESQYGDHGFVVQELPKERRQAGERGQIIGNWKYVDPPSEADRPSPPKSDPAPTQETFDHGEEDDDIPF